RRTIIIRNGSRQRPQKKGSERRLRSNDNHVGMEDM
ncbi:unnamed protein product, partial [Heterotrigona itama]